MTKEQREAISDVPGVTRRTLRNWTRESKRGAPREFRPPGSPRRPEAARAAVMDAVRVVLARLGMGVGEGKVHRELGGALISPS